MISESVIRRRLIKGERKVKMLENSRIKCMDDKVRTVWACMGITVLECST